jgi:hypothetical protein
MLNQNDSKLLAMTLGGVLFLALLFVTSPAWAATPIAPYVTNTNLNNDGTYTLSGTAEPGTRIRITGGESAAVATTTFGGTWSVTVDVEDEDDLSDLSITSTNSQGEMSSSTRLNDDGTVFLGNAADSTDDDRDDQNGDDNNDNVVPGVTITAMVLPGVVYTQ